MTQPVKGPLASLTEEEFSRFIWKLGILLFNSVQASSFARHEFPMSTVADYLDINKDDTHADCLAKEYFRGIAKRKRTQELAVKWFHGEPSEIAETVSGKLAELRKGKPKESPMNLPLTEPELRRMAETIGR
jgi:hypothetical protein